MTEGELISLWIELGKILFKGIKCVEKQEKFTGIEIENTYHTHFPMPDNRTWEITVKRRH